MTVQCLHFAHLQIGRGMPQYRCREMHQSRRLLVQSSWRADPAQSGNHLTRPTSSTIFGLKSVTLRNHWTVARNKIGVLHRQQWPYAWRIVRSGWRYASPTRSLLSLASTTEYFVTPPRAMTSGTALSMSQTYSGFLPCGIFTFAYRKSGCAAIARLAGRVHGVVVQISRDSSGLPARRNLT